MDTPAPQPTALAKLKELISIGTLLSTGIGLVVGATGVVHGAYQHFAKASDLAALRVQNESALAEVRRFGVARHRLNDPESPATPCRS